MFGFSFGVFAFVRWVRGGGGRRWWETREELAQQFTTVTRSFEYSLHDTGLALTYAFQCGELSD